jgi:serine/threonine-protein kinase RsbT
MPPSRARAAPGKSEVRHRIQSSADIVAARQEGRALAARAGFSTSNLTVIATVISEVARNIVDYAKEGHVRIALIHDGRKKGIEIVASDHGPGIPDLAAVMREGYSTGRGMGIGLPGARRLMDEFEIASEVGKGTTVWLKKWA